MSMITATVWVPRGYAATFPTKYDVDEHELARISKLAKLKLDDANEELGHAHDHKGENNKTDDDSDEEDDRGVQILQSKG